MNLTACPWHAVFFAGFVVYGGTRHVFLKRTRAVERTERRVDGTERALMAVVMAGTMALPLGFLFTRWLSFADYRLPAAAPWCGLVVMLAGLRLFWRAHADLGLNWSPTLELRKEHEIVRHGVYRSVRHPMYAAIWLVSLSQGLLLSNWLAGWSAVAAFGTMYFIRVPREERMMRDAFGDAYCDYMKQTGRLWPRFGSETTKRA